MKIFNNRLCCLTMITFFALLPIGCGDESENSVQASIDTLMIDLDIAINESDASALEDVISNALRLRPSSKTQTQSKNLVLATARGKLAQLKYKTIASKIVLASNKLQLAALQSAHVAILRSKASSLSKVGQQQGDNLSQELKSALEPFIQTYTTRLREVTSRISQLETQSKADRDKARELRTKAEDMFTAAEQAGLIDGHKTYKRGVVAIRQSQQIDMAAADVELLAQVQEVPQRDDTKAELEAIAKIINSMQYTQELLRRLRTSSVDSAAAIRQVADELDNETATMMNDAIESASLLIQSWDDITATIDDALQGSRQGGNISRETQQANATWAFDLLWSLGQIEESKRSFLIEESIALTTIIDSGIVTSSSKWQELLATTQASIESTTSNAIAAYEKVKQYASKTGTQGEILANQLDARIARLQGQTLELPSESIELILPVVSSTPTEGFLTPHEVITAFNNILSPAEFDGSTPSPNLLLFYLPADEAASNILRNRQSLQDAATNLLFAIYEKLGASVVQEFTQMSQQANTDFIVDIDINTLQMQGDNTATATDLNGSSVTLRQTPKGWKIVFVPSNEEIAMNAMAQDMLAPVIQAMQVVVDQINAGQITSIEQVFVAIGSAMGG